MKITTEMAAHIAALSRLKLSEGEAEALTQAARRSGLRQKALNLLTSKPMSRRELEQKLRSWEAGEEEAAAIADRMEELGVSLKKESE